MRTSLVFVSAFYAFFQLTAGFGVPEHSKRPDCFYPCGCKEEYHGANTKDWTRCSLVHAPNQQATSVTSTTTLTTFVTTTISRTVTQVEALLPGAEETKSASASASTSTRLPPDNCWIGGPCDCRNIEPTGSEEWFQCVTNPACEHCWINNGTLTSKSGVVPSTPTPSSTKLPSVTIALDVVATTTLDG
ncbi:hypothetical protein N3K66_005295 [Trichothecium roseum]|uniref:Uncharacterized protein n=1 Tax=Trichothecium roseum TaxID=47278 RepID=A0ACC0UYR9_9HYPO|nr:hypothetical protein N3K66_005295 [Trichothecium roseum]